MWNLPNRWPLAFCSSIQSVEIIRWKERIDSNSIRRLVSWIKGLEREFTKNNFTAECIGIETRIPHKGKGWYSVFDTMSEAFKYVSGMNGKTQYNYVKNRFAKNLVIILWGSTLWSKSGLIRQTWINLDFDSCALKREVSYWHWYFHSWLHDRQWRTANEKVLIILLWEMKENLTCHGC